MICVIKLSLKVVQKTKMTFVLSESLLFFLDQKYILFSETYFFKIPKNLADTKILTESLKMIMWLCDVFL